MITFIIKIWCSLDELIGLYTVRGITRTSYVQLPDNQERLSEIVTPRFLAEGTDSKTVP